MVVSEFNKEISSRMLAVARQKAESMGLEITHTCKVPGAYDMPIMVNALLQMGDVDGVVTLGAIIKGQTKHDETISNSVAQALTSLSLKYQRPVTLGITGPAMSKRQAHARIRPVAERAVEAAAKIVTELERIRP